MDHVSISTHDARVSYFHKYQVSVAQTRLLNIGTLTHLHHPHSHSHSRYPHLRRALRAHARARYLMRRDVSRAYRVPRVPWHKRASDILLTVHRSYPRVPVFPWVRVWLSYSSTGTWDPPRQNPAPHCAQRFRTHPGGGTTTVGKNTLLSCASVPCMAILSC